MFKKFYNLRIWKNFLQYNCNSHTHPTPLLSIGTCEFIFTINKQSVRFICSHLKWEGLVLASMDWINLFFIKICCQNHLSPQPPTKQLTQFFVISNITVCRITGIFLVLRNYVSNLQNVDRGYIYFITR